MKTSAPGRIDARKNLRGMRVAIKGDWDSETTVWTVLDRSPRPGCWWLHRYDQDGAWVTCEARYSHLVQIVE